MKDKPIDYKASYLSLAEENHAHRLTIASKDRIIEALKIENECYRTAIKEGANLEHNNNEHK